MNDHEQTAGLIRLAGGLSMETNAAREVADFARGVETADLSPEALPTLWRHRGAALRVADFVVIVAMFLVAYYVRFDLHVLVAKNAAVHPVDLYLGGALILATVWVFLVQREGGYEVGIRGIASQTVRVRCIFLAGAKAMVVLMAVSYAYRDLLLSRQVYLMTGLLAFSAMTLIRFLFRELDRDLASQGLALQRVLVAGLDAQTRDFARHLTQAGSTVKLAGFVALDGGPQPPTFFGYPVLGCLEHIRDIYDRHPFDKLALSHSALGDGEGKMSAERLIEIVNFCEACGIALYSLPNVLSIAVSQDEVATFSGMPIIKLCDASLHPGYAVVKRVMDLVVGGILLALGSWLWLSLAILIKLTSRGPAVFTQMRVGLHGRLFRIYKFRSMVPDAEARLKELVDIGKLEVPGFKLKGDPRVTPLGRFLRRTSLDEIPQLINVMKGEMSLIGPRPEMPALVERYNASQRRRMKAKPGMTGYQQVMARGVPLAAAIEYDLVYLKHQSLLLDLYIMLKTIDVVVRGRGVTH